MTRSCHEKLSEHDGIIDCFVGTQECRGGLWSQCGGSNVSFSSTNVDLLASQASGGGLRPMTVGRDTDAGACAGDPCNPYCSDLGEDDAGSRADGGSTVLYTYSGSEWGNAPGGFIGKQDCTSDGCSATSGFPHACNGAPTHYNVFDACQADHHCNNVGAGACVANTSPPAWTWPLATCAGIDLTVGPSCKSGGVEGFSVCNRGNTAMTVAQGPIRIEVETGNAYDFSGATCKRVAAGSETCAIALTAPLAPGSCIRVSEAACPGWGNGNEVAYINSNQGVPECGGNASGVGRTQPGCNNNWSDIKKGGSLCASAIAGVFTNTTLNFPFSGSCAPGEQLSWNKFIYNVGVPAGTQIDFDMQATKRLEDGGMGSTWPGVGAYQSLAINTTSKNCALTGPAGCPIDLAAIMGTPAKSYESINMRVTLKPNALGTVSPTLYSWSISYNCAPAE